MSKQTFGRGFTRVVFDKTMCVKFQLNRYQSCIYKKIYNFVYNSRKYKYQRSNSVSGKNNFLKDSD